MPDQTQSSLDGRYSRRQVLHLAAAMRIPLLSGTALRGRTIQPAGQPEQSGRLLPIGLHYFPTWDRPKDADQIRAIAAIGFRYVRVGVTGHLLLRDRSRFDDWFTRALRDQIAMLSDAGLTLLLIYAMVPPRLSGNGSFWCPTPAAAAEHARGFAYLAEQYGDRVLALEYWNEPQADDGRFWCGARARADEYVHMLRAAYTAAKSANPNTVVLAGALAGTDLAFATALYEASRIHGPLFDALSVHPYPLIGQGPDDCSDVRWSFRCGLQRLHDLQLRYEADPKLWVTEIGFSTREYSPEQQAAHLVRCIQIARSLPYIAALIVFCAVDRAYDDPSVPLNDREQEFGIYRADLTPKSAVAAVQQALRST